MSNAKLVSVALGAFLAVLSAACTGGSGESTDSTTVPASSPAASVEPEVIIENQSNSRITIINNESELEDRIRLLNEPVWIEPASQDSGSGTVQKAPGSPAVLQAGNLSLTLVSEVRPPSIGSVSLQASSVKIVGKYAYVSYNMQGSEFLGAIDVLDISKPDKPKLVSQAIFQDSDIHSLNFANGYVYAAQGTDRSEFPSTAVFERIGVKNGKLVLEDNSTVPLTSFAGTSVGIAGKLILATSGDNGGLSVFNAADLSRVGHIALDDARWVDVDGKTAVVVQGTPGRLTVVNTDTLQQIKSIPFVGADIPESKSVIELSAGLAFVAAGSGGTQIVHLATGLPVGLAPAPIVAGLSPSVTVTNAVSVEGDLLFMSNGEAGVYVADVPSGLSGNPGSPVDLEIFGRLALGDLQSANHVEYKGNVLFVAAGLGGLKIVNVKNGGKDDGEDDGIIGVAAR